MTINWPAGLPLPTVEYGYQERAPVLETDFGHTVRSRLLRGGALADLRLQFAFTFEQWALFQGFFRHELAHGTEWVTVDVTVAGEVESREVNFAGDMPQYQGPTPNGVMVAASAVTRGAVGPSLAEYLDLVGGTQPWRFDSTVVTFDSTDVTFDEG